MAAQQSPFSELVNRGRALLAKLDDNRQSFCQFCKATCGISVPFCINCGRKNPQFDEEAFVRLHNKSYAEALTECPESHSAPMMRGYVGLCPICGGYINNETEEVEA